MDEMKIALKKVREISPAIENFIYKQLNLTGVSLSTSKPWYPYPKYDGEKDTIMLLGGVTGIYLFSEPGEPWDISLEENSNEIWYIGMSADNTIRGRIWKHLDPVSGEKRKVVSKEKSEKALFTAAEWDERANVSKTIRDAIVLGKFVAYSIRMDFLDGQPDLVRQLEKWLIESYKTTNGRRPVFNLRS